MADSNGSDERSSRNGELDELLQAARQADGLSRAAFRDPIAGHGLPALKRVASWMTDASFEPGVRWLAVSVVLRIGEGYRDQAIAALRVAATSAPDERTREDATAGLARLGASAPRAPRPLNPTDWKTSVTRTGGGRWPGFQDHEFGYVKGTRWRARDGSASLAPLLVTELRYLEPTFESYAVERIAQLHLATPARYRVPNEHEQGFRASKRVVYASGPTSEEPTLVADVVAGWYLEKSGGSSESAAADDLWDWPYFVRALHSEPFRDELARAMVAHDLLIGAYLGQSFGREYTPGWIGRYE